MSPIDTTRNEQFQQAFFARLLDWCYACQDHYWVSDDRCFGPRHDAPLLSKLKHRVKILLGRRGFANRNFDLLTASTVLTDILTKCSSYAYVYALLSDDYSKRVFLDVLCYRTLGSQHVRMPINTPALFRNYDSAEKLLVKRNTGAVRISPSETAMINQYRLPGKSGTLNIHMSSNGYRNFVELHQYDYDRGGISIGAEAGDIVIDGGGCYGDTAIFFADRVAPTGRVYTFEFVPENLAIIRQNLASNPEIARTLVPVEKALGDVSGTILEYAPHGPGTQIGASLSGNALESVASLALDDLVAQNNLAAVNFIKMDIEGAELSALRGAKETLCRFRPKLAIAAYHKPDDLFTLAAYIDNLGLGYRFYLDHFSIHAEETVLFACCGPQT